jgi:MFS family permease
VAYITTTFGFLPLFFIQARHLPAQEMSVLMSVLGISGLALGIALPAASDRIVRKPIMIVSSLIGMLCPLAALCYSGPVGVLALLLFIGWAIVGAAPLTFATIPSESVPPGSVSTALGLIVALSTIVGGVASPLLAGWSADQWGLSAPLIFEVSCCMVIAAACLCLTETAPRKLAQDARVAKIPRSSRKISSN